MSALVHQATGTTSTAATTQVATLTSSTAGNLLVAIFSNAGGTTNSISAVSDSSSTAWTLATNGSTSGVTNTRTAMYYRANCPSGITTATATQGSAIGHWWVAEFSGILTASPANTMSPTDSTAASSTTIATPSIVTTAVDLLIAWWHSSTTTATSPGGIWVDATTPTDASAMTKIAYSLDQASGTYSATWTSLATAKNPGTATASFKAAAASTTPRAPLVVNRAALTRASVY